MELFFYNKLEIIVVIIKMFYLRYIFLLFTLNKLSNNLFKIIKHLKKKHLINLMNESKRLCK